jgi:hypothetical protein
VQFNSKSFLRQVSNPTLARFFSRYPTFSEFDWQTLKEHQVEPIFETWNTLPDDERREATRISRQAHALASVRGTRALIEAGRERNLDLTEKLKPFKSGHERALTCFLDHPDVFGAARILDHVDGLPRRSWERRNGLALLQLAVTEEMKRALAQRISDFYRQRDGRAEHCKVEHQVRGNGCDWFFSYPADYDLDELGYDDDGDLERRPRRSVFEVVFVYDGATGNLDLYAEGGRPIRDELVAIFTEAVLGHRQEPEPYKRPPFDLALFKNPNLTLATRPEHGIARIYVHSLRFRTHSKSAGQIMALTESPGVSAYQVIHDHLDPRTATLADVTLLEVTLKAEFQRPGKRNRVLPFKITPNSCDLGDSPEEEILKAYVREWEINRGD